MIDPNEARDDRSPRPGTNGTDDGRRNGEALEDRLRKLETLLTELQVTRVSEDAVADRVVGRLTELAEHRRPNPDGLLLDGPGEVRALATTTPAPPSGAVLHPPTPTDPGRQKWFFAQIVSELRLTGRMYFDPRYRVSRTTQFALPVILLLFALNYFFFSVWFHFPVVSPILERVTCVVLGVLFYKLLSRELGRYRDVLDYLTRHGFR